MVGLTVRIDPHVHSEASYDGSDPVDLLLEQAAEIGLDGIVVTDHDVVHESLRAAKLAPEYGLVGIPGVEVSTGDGHLLALGVEKMPPRGAPFGETVDWVHARGGVAIVPHPFQRSRHGVRRRTLVDCDAREPSDSRADGTRRSSGTVRQSIGPMTQRRRCHGSGDVDAIEVYNSWLFTGYKNRRARRFARLHGYPGVAGSDAHTVPLVGRAYTELTVPVTTRADLTADAILNAVREGSTSIEGRRAPISMSARHYAIGAVRKSEYAARTGARKGFTVAKTGAHLGAQALARLSPLRTVLD